MDLRKARTNVESGGLESAFLRIFNAVEVEIGYRVVKVSFSVVERVEVENVALDARVVQRIEREDVASEVKEFRPIPGVVGQVG
jgi:hypothetical protein